MRYFKGKECVFVPSSMTYVQAGRDGLFDSITNYGGHWVVHAIPDFNKNALKVNIFCNNFEEKEHALNELKRTFPTFDIQETLISVHDIFSQVLNTVDILEKYNPTNKLFINQGVMNWSLLTFYKDENYIFNTTLDLASFGTIELKDRLKKTIREDTNIRQCINNGLLDKLIDFNTCYRNSFSKNDTTRAFRRSTYSNLKTFLSKFDYNNYEQLEYKYYRSQELVDEIMKYKKMFQDTIAIICKRRETPTFSGVYNGIHLSVSTKNIMCTVLGNKIDIIDNFKSFTCLLECIGKKDQFFEDIEKFKIRNS